MLNTKAINDVLKKAPLCQGYLMRDAGMTREYCAMGALAKACGVSDTELKNFSPDGGDLFFAIQGELKQKFGIETLNQFQSLMTANDSVTSPIERTKVVLKAVEALSPEQVNDIINNDSPVSAE